MTAAEKRVLEAVRAWRSARCLGRHKRIRKVEDGIMERWCDGENHAADCPCELARQEILAADNALELAR